MEMKMDMPIFVNWNGWAGEAPQKTENGNAYVACGTFLVGGIEAEDSR